MGNKIVILIVLSLFSVSWTLGAQNLDPTVEVTREYEGKLMEIHKPALVMSVPDSLTRFALDFDYSVFENPYKGAYDFNPYSLSLRPSTSDSGENKFYLRAGAGYQLHPELDLVWSPKLRKNSFNVDVYALHRSFVGDYWKLDVEPVSDSECMLTRKSESGDDGTWFGYDLMSRAGADCRYDSESVAVGFGAGYYGLSQKDRLWDRNFNALDAHVGVSTKPEDPDMTTYDIGLSYRFGRDRLSSSGLLSEHLLNFDLAFGPVRRGNHRLSFDLGVETASYSDAFSCMVGEVSVSPRYVFGNDRTRLDLGLHLAKIVRAKDMDGMYGAAEQYVYPDITFSWAVIPEAMKFYIKATGGNKINTYSSILSRNHHMTFAAAPALLDCTVERISAAAGFDGRISSRFSYNVRGGYANYANALLDAVDNSGVPCASLRYAPYQKWFVSFDWALKTEDISFDGVLSYDRAWGDVFDSGYVSVAVLKPAFFTGDISFEYNWNRRIFCGADCSFSTSRKGVFGVPPTMSDLVPQSILEISGYADLGIFGEYATARGISFWLRVGNILNMTVQRNPLYAERGVNFTLGICLSL